MSTIIVWAKNLSQETSYGPYAQRRTLDGIDISSRQDGNGIVTSTAWTACDSDGWRLEVYCWLSPYSALPCMSWTLVRHGRRYCSVDYPVEYLHGRSWQNLNHAVLDAQERVAAWSLWVRSGRGRGKYRSFRDPECLPWT